MHQIRGYDLFKISLKKIIFLFLIIFTTNVLSQELKKVTLQLSWFDQFQFAGYYVAKEKGFYKQLGLDVEIIPFKFGIDVPKLVGNNSVDFGVGRETLILDKSNGQNIVALYALFQSSPLILLSTQQSGINSVEKFKNKRVMTTIDDAGEVSLKAMISSNKINFSDLTFLMHSHNINDLIENKTDLISAYTSKAPFELQKRGIKYNTFEPKDYGFDMYSDFLFTSNNLISQDKKIVDAFKEASLKGWKFAYANINESVELILNKYNSQFLSREELIFEALELKKLSFYNNSILGEIKKEKLQRIYDLYNVMGLISNTVNINEFIYDELIKYENRIHFLQELDNYIKNRDTINVCTLIDAKPFSYLQDEKIKGFVPDYFELVSKLSSLRFNFVKTKSINESLKLLNNNSCDISAMVEDTNNNKELFSFTQSYFKIPFVLVTNSQSSFIDDLKMLRNKKISYTKEYFTNINLKELYPNIEFVEVNSLKQGIEKISNSQVYGHIDLLYSSWYEIYSNNLNKLRISSKLDESLGISMALKKDDLKLLEILNLTINNISELKKDEILSKYLTIKYKNIKDYSILWKILLGVVLVLLLILYRQKILREANTNLKKMVEEKNKDLIQINEQLEERIKKEVLENLKKDRILAQQSKLISMGQMIENIAHQWRQPLSLITTISSSLKLKNQLTALQKDEIESSLDSIMKTANYLSKTIDDFRYFFEPKNNKELFSVRESILKVIDLIKSSLYVKNIEIILNCEDDIKINGYENELVQVIINILNNSKDALLNSNKNEKMIFIEICENENNVVLIFKDNAFGIDEAILEKIYEPYFTTKHKSQGTGIGLFMCKEIIQKHMNGKIETSNTQFVFNNEKQTGALTTIILPKD